MRWAVVLLIASGCRQLLGLDEPQPVPTDAAPSADAVDALPPTSCIQRWLDGTAVLASPEAVGGLVNTSAPERNPFLVTVGMSYELYFSREGDIYRAPGTPTTFGLPEPENALNSPSAESRISLNLTRTRAYFVSNRNGGAGSYDIWRAMRSDASQAWSIDQVQLGAINDAKAQTDPHITNDLLRLYYAPEATPQRIAVALRSGTAQAFSAPIPIAGIHANTGDDFDPSLTADERVIVFASNRSGVRDLYYATRADSTGSFAQERPLATLNTEAAGEDNPHITPDGCRLYFSSDAGGDNDIYTAVLLD